MMYRSLIVAAWMGLHLTVVFPLYAAILPDGFTEEVVAANLDLPTDAAYASDGHLFIALKGGSVVVVHPDGSFQSSKFIALDDEINNAGDRGLLSVAADPNFEENRYVYLFYVVDPEEGAPDESATMPTFGRLTRYTAIIDNGTVTADPSSRLVLIGATPAEGIPVCYDSHSVGDLNFAADGSLFLSTGDGASEAYVDYGQNATEYAERCEALFPEQDMGAFRAQNLDSMAGKVLRIDPATGFGFMSNPFYTGHTSSYRSRVWASGFRNPFRFGINPNTDAPGSIYLGDVGWYSYEELNLVVKGGNYGWPCWEGDFPQSEYVENSNTSLVCASDVPAEVVTSPIVQWTQGDSNHLGFAGGSVIGGGFYAGTSYPGDYQGLYFFMDFVGSWMRTLEVESGDIIGRNVSFASDLAGPVSLTFDPRDQNVVYVSIYTGEVRKVYYHQQYHAPVAMINATPLQGSAPLTVTFDASDSYDVDGDSLTYRWDLGDGAGSTDAAFTHMYTAAGTYTATLTVSDTTDRHTTTQVVIAVDNTAPNAVIVAPQEGFTYDAPTLILVQGDATDAEDATLPDSAFQWSVELHHDEHVHYGWISLTGRNGSFTAEVGYWYTITLTVTDSGGLNNYASVDIFPTPASEADCDDCDDSVTSSGDEPDVPAGDSVPVDDTLAPAPTSEAPDSTDDAADDANSEADVPSPIDTGDVTADSSESIAGCALGLN